MTEVNSHLGVEEMAWMVEGDGRFFAKKPTLNSNTIGGRIATRSSDFLVIMLRPRSEGDELKIADDATIYPKKIFITSSGLLFRPQDRKEGLRNDFEEIWDPERNSQEEYKVVSEKLLVCWLRRGITRNLG
jgi:hypothetical protein